MTTLGRSIVAAVAAFGQFVGFAGLVAHTTITSPRRWSRWRQLGPQLYAVGIASIPVVAVTGAFIGMVLALETYLQFESFGQEARLGGVINISVTKQLGPVLAAVMVAGRVGGSMAAELGSMRVTEQISAYRVMGTDPIGLLVAPRVIACLIMTPILTIYSDVLGVAGGWLVTVGLYDVSAAEYWDFTARFVGWWAPAAGLIKSVFFGGAIGLIACYKGFTCRGGAAGVGRATTEAFVASFLAIIMLNLVLAKFLNTVDLIWITGDLPNPLD